MSGLVRGNAGSGDIIRSAACAELGAFAMAECVIDVGGSVFFR